MNYTVYEGTHTVGEVELQPKGLYYEIKAMVSCHGTIRRIYGICGSESFYLGIPDRNGELFRRISKMSIPIPDYFVLSELTPQEWRTNFISHDRDIVQSDHVNQEMFIADIGSAEQEPLREIEINTETDDGGNENETLKQNHSDDLDPLLLADLPADYDYGGTGAEEVDCNYIR